MSILLTLSLIASAAALLVAVGAVALVRRSLPNELIQGQADLTTRVLAAEANLEGHGSRLLAWREEIEAVLDAVDTTLERTERKRRSIAASAAKLNGGQAAADDLDPRAALTAKARAQGFNV